LIKPNLFIFFRFLFVAFVYIKGRKTSYNKSIAASGGDGRTMDCSLLSATVPADE